MPSWNWPTQSEASVTLVSGTSGAVAAITSSGGMLVHVSNPSGGSTGGGSASTEVSIDGLVTIAGIVSLSSVHSVTVTNPTTAVTVNVSTAVNIANTPLVIVASSAGYGALSGGGGAASTAVNVLTPAGSAVHLLSTSIGTIPKYRLLTTVATLSSVASKLYGVHGASTVIGPVFLQLYNATSSAVSIGTVALTLPIKLTSAAITVDPHYGTWWPLHGMQFPNGISAMFASASTGTGAVQGYCNLEVLGT